MDAGQPLWITLLVGAAGGLSSAGVGVAVAWIKRRWDDADERQRRRLVAAETIRTERRPQVDAYMAARKAFTDTIVRSRVILRMDWNAGSGVGLDYASATLALIAASDALAFQCNDKEAEIVRNDRTRLTDWGTRIMSEVVEAPHAHHHDRSPPPASELRLLIDPRESIDVS